MDDPPWKLEIILGIKQEEETGAEGKILIVFIIDHGHEAIILEKSYSSLKRKVLIE